MKKYLGLAPIVAVAAMAITPATASAASGCAPTDPPGSWPCGWTGWSSSHTDNPASSSYWVHSGTTDGSTCLTHGVNVCAGDFTANGGGNSQYCLNPLATGGAGDPDTTGGGAGTADVTPTANQDDNCAGAAVPPATDPTTGKPLVVTGTFTNNPASPLNGTPVFGFGCNHDDDAVPGSDGADGDPCDGTNTKDFVGGFYVGDQGGGRGVGLQG